MKMIIDWCAGEEMSDKDWEVLRNMLEVLRKMNLVIDYEAEARVDGEVMNVEVW